MRCPLIVGNWKMNGTRHGAKQLLGDLLAGLGREAGPEVGVCVPYVFIPDAAEQLAETSIALGSQNVADQESGAFTAEVAASMLKEFHCQLAIVGHSERRALYQETDALVAARYSQAIAHGIQPILCVGETLEQRDHGKTFDVVDEQLSAVLNTSGAKSLFNAVIAYEPVWAIGTGMTATVDQAQEVHAFIRNRVAELDKAAAEQVRILYGGSVKPDNAAGLFAMPDIDGGLIGGASLDAQAFLAICHATQADG